MSRKPRLDAENRTRVGVICSKQQKALLEAAAKRAGTDLGTLILTYALRGLGALAAADHGPQELADAPVIINGRVGAALRARATEQGVPPDRMLELMLVAEG